MSKRLHDGVYFKGINTTAFRYRLRQAINKSDETRHLLPDDTRTILRYLMKQPIPVREAVIMCIDPTYKDYLLRLLLPTRVVNREEHSGYRFARYATANLSTLRKKVGSCPRCQGFLELSHDDVKRAVAKCINCGRERTVKA